MAAYSMTNVGLLLDSVSLGGFVNELDGPSVSAPMVDFTNFASGGWKFAKPGTASYTFDVKGYQAYASGEINSIAGTANVAAQTADVFTLLPISTPSGAAVADPAYLGTGFESNLSALSGQVGAAAAFSGTWTGTGRLVEGSVAHPQAARTATGNGTAFAFTPPTASQSLWASFHVLSVSGAGTITFTVQTATLIGFGSPTTRITSSAFAAVGSELDSLAGVITDGFVRVSWTIAGFTSVTFAAAIGVG